MFARELEKSVIRGMEIKKTELEIGDRVRVQNAFNDFVVTINRVTKTKAVGIWGNGGSMDFKRSIGGFGVESYARVMWNTTNYTLLEN